MSKTLLGVVHLAPLPGSPRHDGQPLEALIRRARIDAERLLAAGFDGYIVENFGDNPFWGERVPPETLTCMTRVALELPRGDAALVGINVLRNDARGALAVAAAVGADLIRVNVHIGAMVTDQGVLEGQAARTLRERRRLARDVRIYADVDVKHAAPLSHHFDLAEAARETAYRGMADALIVTGAATGRAASLDDLRSVREAVPDRPLLVGSGSTPETVRALLDVADGVIVGTSVKVDRKTNNPVDPENAAAFVAAAR